MKRNHRSFQHIQMRKRRIDWKCNFSLWRFCRSRWRSMILKKLQHEHSGPKYHIRRSLFIFLYHRVRSEQYNLPYFKIFKLKKYRTAKPKSNKNTCSLPIRVCWKRCAHPFCDILSSMRFPDKIFQFPVVINSFIKNFLKNFLQVRQQRQNMQ